METVHADEAKHQGVDNTKGCATQTAPKETAKAGHQRGPRSYPHGVAKAGDCTIKLRASIGSFIEAIGGGALPPAPRPPRSATRPSNLGHGQQARILVQIVKGLEALDKRWHAWIEDRIKFFVSVVGPGVGLVLVSFWPGYRVKSAAVSKTFAAGKGCHEAIRTARSSTTRKRNPAANCDHTFPNPLTRVRCRSRRIRICHGPALH